MVSIQYQHYKVEAIIDNLFFKKKLTQGRRPEQRINFVKVIVLWIFKSGLYIMYVGDMNIADNH